MDSTLLSIPISNLKDNFAQIVDFCEKEPIILTKDGNKPLVVMNFDMFNEQRTELERLKTEIEKMQTEIEALELIRLVGLDEDYEKDEEDDMFEGFFASIEKKMMDANNFSDV